MLADHATITREHLSELENGRKEAGIKTVEQIASALGITLAELFDRM
jgi:transcriptional regulator with XRE-family HTH domain